MPPLSPNDLSGLARSGRLRNELAQIGAFGTLSDLSIGELPNFTFSVERVVRNVAGLSVWLQGLIEDGSLREPGAIGTARYLAQAWERLAGVGDRVDRISALLNASIYYELAGYQANAACLARHARTESAGERPVVELASRFMDRQFMELNRLGQRLAKQPSNDFLDQQSDHEVATAAAAAVFGLALRQAARYFLAGDEMSLRSAQHTLDRVTDGLQDLSLVQEANMANALSRLIPVMANRSTWHHLSDALPENPRWRRYLRVIGRGTAADVQAARSISELWPSQLRALDAGLLTSHESLVVRMPTSAGKTRVAEMSMVHTLVRTPGARCIYVAPYRALVTEVETSFASLFTDLGYAASSIPGAFEQDSMGEVIASRDDVLVVTPEKLDLLLRIQPNQLDTVELIVVDEGHLVGDKARGPKFELLLSRLRRVIPNARFLFMSAVVPQDTLDQFARWLAVGERSGEVSTDWRPSVLRYAKLEWGDGRGTLRYSSADVEDGGLQFVANLVRRREFAYINPETRYRNRPKFPDTKGQVAAELAYRYAATGPVLVFTSTTVWAESVAKELLRRIELAELTDEEIPHVFRHRETRSHTVAMEWLGEEHLITEMLRFGIAFHHGRLPAAVKEAIELDVRSRRISVLVATNTLAQGVNLPFRTVVMHSCARFDEDEQTMDRLSARDYWNIAGRAGRAGEETEGLVIHIAQTRRDDADFEYYERHRDAVEPVESALLQLLSDLVTNRISRDELATRLDSDLLALLVEEVDQLAPEEAVSETLSNSLFSVQALDRGVDISPMADVMFTTARAITERVEDAEARRLYASTGLSSLSCIEVREHVETDSDELRELLASTSLGDLDRLSEILIDGTSGLIEMSSSAPSPGDTLTTLDLWLDGTPVADMSQVLDSEPSELTRYLEDVFAYKLPWGLASYLRIATFALDVPLSQVVSNFPGMVKYGVPSPEAVWAMTSGVAARTPAILVANRYLSSVDESSPTGFRQWLARLDPDSVAEDLSLSGLALESTAQAILSSQRNQYLDKLDRGEPLLPLEATAMLTRESRRVGTAYRARVGQFVELLRNYDNTLNRNAVDLLLDGERLGYLEWQAAQAVGLELDVGDEIVGQILELDSSVRKFRVLLERVGDVGSAPI